MRLHNINSIARYELKLLRRSWLFRIFAILVVLIVFQRTGGYALFRSWYLWDEVSITSYIPAKVTYVYNIVQSIIVIFLAGNFIKRDKKLDTSEVIYVRPISNAEYVFGKVLGVVRGFLGLNIVCLCIGMAINIFITQSPFSIFPYIIYLFTISLPSLLFVLGLSFVAISFFKNQAVTFMIMLGVILMDFFYLSEELYGVFDFFGAYIPTVFSDITGHPGIKQFLWQRATFLVLSIGFILLTIALVNRLPLRPWKSKLIGAISVFVILFGLGIGGWYVHSFQSRITKREIYREVYNKYAGLPEVNVLANDLTIEPSGRTINITSRLSIKNKRDTVVEHIILYLNPSLHVTSLMENYGKNLVFTREAQVLSIDRAILPGEELEMTLKYSGKIDEDICYTDMEDKDYFMNFYEMNEGYRYAYLDEKFTLLTPECIWYPVSTSPAYPAIPYNIKKQFTYYTLNYLNSGNKTVISQGKYSQTGDTVKYINEIPLVGISLTVGEYEKKSITVDSLDYELYYYKGHDFFSEYFREITDTLPQLIRDFRNTTEVRKNSDYVFSKFTLVESPISFTTFKRNWKENSESIMPEIIFMPERGSYYTFDFEMSMFFMKQRGRPGFGDGEKMEGVDMEATIFQEFVSRTFIDESSEYSNYNIGAMFFGLTGFLYSDQYPVMDIVLNTLLNTQQGASIGALYFGWANGYTDEMKANIYLGEHSFKEAMGDKSLEHVMFYEMLKLKSAYIRNYILSKVSEEQFLAFIKKFKKAHVFKEVSVDELIRGLKEELDIDLTEILDEWYNIKRTPLIEIKDVDAKLVLKDEFTKYRVVFKVYNPTDIDGQISVSIQSGGGGMRGGGFRMGGGQNVTKPIHYTIPAKSAWEVKYINDDRPNGITIHTGISQNLPNTYSYPFSRVRDEVADTTEGMFPVDTTLFLPDPKVIIVDNEDSGFKLVSPNQKQKLKELFKEEEKDKYGGFRPWDFPLKWMPIIESNAYGSPVNSLVYKQKGDGRYWAEWTAKIPKDSYYELSVWNPKLESNMRRIGWFRNEPNTHTYFICYGEEEEKIELDMTQGEVGWVSLGNFYLTAGEVVVKLSDKVSNQLVMADAIKWTLINGR